MEIRGTPSDVGADLWDKVILPILLPATQSQPPEVTHAIYFALLSSALGSAAADFGHAGALDLARRVTAQFEGLADEIAPAKPQ